MVLFLQAYKEKQLSESDFLCAFSWAVCKYLKDNHQEALRENSFRKRFESIAYEASTNRKNSELEQAKKLFHECLAGNHQKFVGGLEIYLISSVQIMKSLTFKYS